MVYFSGHCDGFFYRGAFDPRHGAAVWSVDVIGHGNQAFCLRGEVPMGSMENDLRLLETAVHQTVLARIRAKPKQPPLSELYARIGMEAQLTF